MCSQLREKKFPNGQSGLRFLSSDRKAAGAQGEGAAQTQEPNKYVFTRL